MTTTSMGAENRFTLEEEIQGLPEKMSVIEAANFLNLPPHSLMNGLQSQGLTIHGKRLPLNTKDIYAALRAEDEQGDIGFQKYLDSDILI